MFLLELFGARGIHTSITSSGRLQVFQKMTRTKTKTKKDKWVIVTVVQVMVASSMVSKLKPHQWEGVRFLYRNIVLGHEVSRLWIIVLVAALWTQCLYWSLYSTLCC